MRNGPGPNGSARGATATYAGVGRDMIARHEKTAPAFKAAAAICGVLLILGIVGFILRLTDGVGNMALWGYHAALFAFILTTCQAAPMAAIAPRMAKAEWRRPISRTAEMFTAVGLFNLLLFIPLLWVLPSLENKRRSLWFFEAGGAGSEYANVPTYSPHIWTGLALLALVVIGLMMLWVSALPDLAALRDHSSGWRQRWGSRLARGWYGTSKQWHMQKHRLGILGAFYFLMLVFVHFLVTVDFAMTLVPGWIDALYPATHAANALQAGAATVIVTMYVLHRWCGYKDVITLEHFWGLGKLMFALSLLWFWFWFSSFIVLWYGKKPSEQAVIELLMTGPYWPIFFTTFLLNFVVPLLVLMWNAVRKSIIGPTLIASGILVGTLLDRIRLYVGAYSVADQSHLKELPLDAIPPAHTPGMEDIFLILGVLGGSVLVYMLATRVFPVINIWERKEGSMYEWHKPFHRTEVKVLAKPE